MVENIKVYIKIDHDKNVVDINSSAFLEDMTDWVEVDEGTGYRYHHAQGNYFPKTKPLNDERNIANYKYIDGEIIERTEEEKQAELDARPPAPPTIEDRLQAFENGYASLLIANCTHFDGIKYVFGRDKPLDVVLPMSVVPNAFYRFEGKIYVGLKSGMATVDTFSNFFAED